jgi:putative ABC transport system permease protein
MTFGSSRIINSALAGGSSPLTMIVSLDVVILSGVVSIAVGIVFGLYPAYRASRLQPVEALRKE